MLKKYTLYYFLLFFVIIIYSCSKDKNDVIIYKNSNKGVSPNFNISLKKAFSINKSSGGSKDSLTYLYNIFMKNDKIYISDYLLAKVFVYNKEGIPLFSFCGKGKGPGELENLSTMGIYKDTIIVSDAVAHKINKFTLSGEFIHAKLNVTKPPTDLKNFKDKYFITTNLHSSIDKKYIKNSITVYDHKLAKIKDLKSYSYPIIKEADSTTINLSKITPTFTMSDNYLYIPDIDEYRYLIRKYDENLQEVAQIRKRYIYQPLSRSQKKDIASNAGYTNKVIEKHQRSIWGIYNDKYNRLWVLAAYKQQDKELKFDIFEDGKYLNTINFPYYQALLTFVQATSNIHFIADYLVVNKTDEVVFYTY